VGWKNEIHCLVDFDDDYTWGDLVINSLVYLTSSGYSVPDECYKDVDMKEDGSEGGK
jgi:hypothetical protein